ncbi:MAG TPA: 3-phosphoshikimate 1-carboxyvinyltransferase [Pyrinomonadaceae bacterium]|jgi:3-phosphoshikimate 1-carboxyvinyltransferase
MRIEPARRLRGRLRLPGDKSISHRAAMIAALASGGGRSRITNYSTSADCASTLACLARLGVVLSRDGNEVVIEGAGDVDASVRSQSLRAATLPLDCGNSGSTMRMMAGILAGQPFTSTLTGDASLRTRPMKRIIEPLTRMGARIASDDARAPLRIEGRRPLEAICYEMPVASAQVKSALLFAGLHADGRTSVVEPSDAATRDHTERMLRWFGVPVEIETESAGTEFKSGDSADERARDFDVIENDFEGRREASLVVSVRGGMRLTARDFDVPGDISSATFLVAAAALLPGSRIEIENVGLNPTRTKFLQIMREFGAQIGTEALQQRGFEDVGDLIVHGASGLAPTSRMGGNVLRGGIVAELIDELPALAVVGTQLEGGLEIRDASELRVKESDRIAATVANLRAMGAEVEEFEDGLAVRGTTQLRGAKLDAHGDHRIAMAFSIAALLAEGASEIAGAECVAVSFPEFFELLESVTER